MAGVFEATVNVAGPMLLVTSCWLSAQPARAVQVMNLTIAGKGTQIATWTVSGGVGLATWMATGPFALVALAALFAGHRIHDRVSTATYMKWLRGFLWLMVGLLAMQFARQRWAA
jgi:hypothetical protein